MKTNFIKYSINFSEILSPIFYKVAYMSIKAMIVGIIIFCLSKILKKFIYPNIRYIIWFIFIIMLLIPIEFESKHRLNSIFPVNMESIQRLPYFENNLDYNNKDAINKEIKNVIGFKQLLTLEQIIPLIWFCVLIIGAIFFILSYEKYNRNLNSENNLVNKRLITIFEKCKKRLNINSNMEIICKKSVQSSSIMGLVKYKILLNSEILELEDDEIEYIVMHELLHYKRRDNLVNIMIIVLRLVYFFNPIVYLLLCEFNNEIERAVDRSVVTYLNEKEKRIYCRLLIKMVVGSKNFFEKVLSLSDNKYILNSRIYEIKNKFNNKNIRKLSVIIFSMCILIVSVGICITDKKLDINETKELLEKGLNFNEYLIETKISYNSNNFVEMKNIEKIDYNYGQNGNNSNIMYITLLDNSIDTNFYYKCLGNKIYNNINCEVVSLYSKTENEFISYDSWIDLETGVILKDEFYYNNKDNIKSEVAIYECIYKYDYNKILANNN